MHNIIARESRNYGQWMETATLTFSIMQSSKELGKTKSLSSQILQVQHRQRQRT
ncbi:hypothetical protein PR202_ga12389 [Eleusine coracana subsp. coracana]|uniref:Uncharacterized protein n=1 Tax=Eleusine coracana subsp. coracana TaxID=191504 RepID=A0AAV5CBZ0_ELECO|nr:hypothetical protein PR202_ga12389 [Eleusine coracana subsp. coracana]